MKAKKPIWKVKIRTDARKITFEVDLRRFFSVLSLIMLFCGVFVVYKVGYITGNSIRNKETVAKACSILKEEGRLKEIMDYCEINKELVPKKNKMGLNESVWTEFPIPEYCIRGNGERDCIKGSIGNRTCDCGEGRENELCCYEYINGHKVEECIYGFGNSSFTYWLELSPLPIYIRKIEPEDTFLKPDEEGWIIITYQDILDGKFDYSYETIDNIEKILCCGITIGGGQNCFTGFNKTEPCEITVHDNVLQCCYGDVQHELNYCQDFSDAYIKVGVKK